MSADLRIALGLGLALGSAGAIRMACRSEPRRLIALMLDLTWPLFAWAWLVVVTGRPMLAGIVVLGIFGGLAFAERAKRRILMEPVIFSDLSLLKLVLRQPSLYLPYVGYAKVGTACFGMALSLAALVVVDAPLAFWTWETGAVGLIGGLIVIWAMAESGLKLVSGLLKRLTLARNPEADSVRYGALGTQLIHGLVARGERPRRQAAVRPPRTMPAMTHARTPPVVLVQAESFFDIRRLSSAIPPGVLPTFERMKRESLLWGRLDVRGRGGNTMRTEFDVLTGLGEAELGLDWRNPYHAFARQPVDSLAWRFKAKGYRTLCIHPFDKAFFARDKVMPNLGFDLFLGEEAFDGRIREGHYIADSEIARLAETLLQDREPIFLFAITIANHGPWHAPAQPILPTIPDCVLRQVGPELLGLVRGLQRTDQMLGRIATAMIRRGDDGLLAFFGDHLPSLPETFEGLGFTDMTTDYLLWRPGHGNCLRNDRSASDLSTAILDQVT